MAEKIDVRMTCQRCAILEAVRGVKSHPTADEVYNMVRKKIPDISLGTVYRNLDILSANGTIKKLGPEEGKMRFDGDTSKHHHVRCIVCGRVDDVEVLSFAAPEARVQRMSDYRITGYSLEFAGICPTCIKEGRESAYSA